MVLAVCSSWSRTALISLWRLSVLSHSLGLRQVSKASYPKHGSFLFSLSCQSGSAFSLPFLQERLSQGARCKLHLDSRTGRDSQSLLLRTLQLGINDMEFSPHPPGQTVLCLDTHPSVGLELSWPFSK